MGSPESFSRVPLSIIVLGKGKIKGEIIKHLAPSTSSSIIRYGRIAGRATLEEGSILILTPIRAGLEKPKNRFAAGDIAFLPLNGALCIFLVDTTTARPMNHVGRVTSEGDLLKEIGRGDTVIFEVEETNPPQQAP
ncbi:MAG: cyclophilin-like family protein [Conexivisphaerales archaeon]|jgi:hypothetical protein